MIYRGRITGVLPACREFEFVTEFGNYLWGHVSDLIKIEELIKYVVDETVLVCHIEDYSDEGDYGSNLFLTKFWVA